MAGVSERKYAGGSANRSNAGRFGLSDCLHLAATPTFALMALLTAVSGGAHSMTCMAMAGSSPLEGMGLMYLLMSVFHAAPWLRLVSRM